MDILFIRQIIPQYVKNVLQIQLDIFSNHLLYFVHISSKNSPKQIFTSQCFLFFKYQLYHIDMQAPSNRYWQYAALVFISFLNGCFISCFGPLIPHFSQTTGLDETEYSYLFMVRSAANVIGGFLVKQLLTRVRTQPLTLVFILIMMVNLYLASLSLNTSNLVITIFITATARVGIVVISFAVVLRIFKGDRPEYWVQLIGFVFGVGAMCGPFIVTIFRLETFKALGFANIVTLAILISNPLPNLEENTEKKEKKGPSLSNKSVIWACLIFFFYSTLELGMGSWISTYAIKAGVATVQGSQIYSFLFWLPNCLGRFIWMYVDGTVERKLRLSLQSMLITAICILLMQSMGLYKMVCILAPFASGIMLAGVFGFGIALPMDKGFAADPRDNANFVLSNALGEGLLITPIGHSIRFLGYQALMIEILAFAILCLWSFTKAVESMNEDKERHESHLMTQLK